MANAEQLALLKASVEGFKEWRKKHPREWINLIGANLEFSDLSGTDLNGANFNEANLSGIDLSEANLFRATLFQANLFQANLFQANFNEADLSKVNFSGANLVESVLSEANLSGSNLFQAKLNEADLSKANLSGANLTEAVLSEVNLSKANLSRTDLRKADLRKANLSGASLSGANLSGAVLSGAVLSGANLSGAVLSGANLSGSSLFQAKLSGANLMGADLRESNLFQANLFQANLSRAFLTDANLNGANLSGADLTGAFLDNTSMVRTIINDAIISKSRVYGVNVWDLEGEFKEQRDLIITPLGQPSITVDNIKVAQFIYLILNNKEIRDVINTLTSKTVLILGRFAIPERKTILDTLRNKLREYDLLPIVFDFDRPTDKDFTETIKTLASISYFVIADVTNPKSSPLELQATVPDYQIPFIPIIQEGEYPFAMMIDLQKKYNWVLDTISYDSLDTLIEILKPHIIDPAIKKRDELRLIKAAEPTIISGRDLLNKK